MQELIWSVTNAVYFLHVEMFCIYLLILDGSISLYQMYLLRPFDAGPGSDLQ